WSVNFLLPFVFPASVIPCPSLSGSFAHRSHLICAHFSAFDHVRCLIVVVFVDCRRRSWLLLTLLRPIWLILLLAIAQPADIIVQRLTLGLALVLWTVATQFAQPFVDHALQRQLQQLLLQVAQQPKLDEALTAAMLVSPQSANSGHSSSG